MTLPDLPPVDLSPERLAHRLALQTRWCGATEKPFTLAQHAALTYEAFLRLAPARAGEAIHALLAAVPEALAGGLPTPTMRRLAPRAPDLRAALDALHAGIAEAVRRRHGLAPPSPEAVALIDAARIVASAIAWRSAMPPGYGPSPYGPPPRHAAAIPILAWPAAEDLVLHLIRLELAGHARAGVTPNAIPSRSAPAPRGRGTTRSVVEGAPSARPAMKRTYAEQEEEIDFVALGLGVGQIAATAPAVQKPALATLPDGAWIRAAQQPNDAGAALTAILKVIDGPTPSRTIRLAAAMMLEPHLLTSLLSKVQAREWRRLVGQEAEPRTGNVVGFAARTNQGWGTAVPNHRGNGRLIEDLSAGTWAPGPGLDAFDTAGWPDGRARFVLEALAALNLDSTVTAMPGEVRDWITPFCPCAEPWC